MRPRHRHSTGRGRLAAAFAVLAAMQLSAAPVKAVLTLDTSPGTGHATDLLRPRAFREGDLVAVVTVSNGPPRRLLALSEDRDALASALQRAAVRVGTGIGRVRIGDNRTVDLAGAIRLACKQLTPPGHGGDARNAVIVFFGSTDPAFPHQMQALKAALDAADARLYAVQIDRNLDQPRNPPGSLPSTLPPVVTAQLVEELAKHSGGRMYRRNWDLKDILEQARKR